MAGQAMRAGFSTADGHGVRPLYTDKHGFQTAKYANRISEFTLQNSAFAFTPLAHLAKLFHKGDVGDRL